MLIIWLIFFVIEINYRWLIGIFLLLLRSSIAKNCNFAKYTIIRKMKIIIAGAGDVGLHLAKLLVKEQQDIVLIDKNEEVLEYAQAHVDAMVIQGDCSSIEVLKDAGVEEANLVLAVTTLENNNIVTSILAKRLGAKATIARVNNPEFLDEEQKEIFRDLGVDKIISPIEFAAQEIERLINLCEVTDNFEFENGKVRLIGITLDDSSSMVGKSVGVVDAQLPKLNFSPIAILRGDETILPRRDTTFVRGDHVYFLATQSDIQGILKETGKQLKTIKNVMIIGGGALGYRTASILEKNYNVTIVEKDKELCEQLVQKLDNALVVKTDPSNLEVLNEEGLEDMDAFIALTPNSEINIIMSLLAEESGVFRTIALVDNVDYTRISQNIGVDTLINKKLIAANNIFRYVRKGKIEAITSLHGVNAEIIEFVIHREGRITTKNLRDLKLPHNCVIGSVIRGEDIFVPTGDTTLQMGDKVIVFVMDDSISEVELFFNK